MATPPKIVSVKKQPTTRPLGSSYISGWQNIPVGGGKTASGGRVPAPAAPAAPAAAAAAAPAAAAPDPRDSVYWARVAAQKTQRDQRRAAVTQQGTYDSSDLKDNLRKIAEARVKGLEGADTSHNKQGLFYSTVLSKARGEIEQGAHDQEASSNEGYRRREAARAAELQGLPTDQQIESDFLGEAIDRRLQLDQNAPAPEADPAAASTVDSAVQAALSRISGGADEVIRPSSAHGGAKWRYKRRASDGQLIPIGPA